MEKYSQLVFPLFRPPSLLSLPSLLDEAKCESPCCVLHRIIYRTCLVLWVLNLQERRGENTRNTLEALLQETIEQWSPAQVFTQCGHPFLASTIPHGEKMNAARQRAGGRSPEKTAEMPPDASKREERGALLGVDRMTTLRTYKMQRVKPILVAF